MSEALAGESDSRRSIWAMLRGLIGHGPSQSLRAQLTEAIDEHEEEVSTPANGDLSAIERQMLRNLLQFSERTADDVAVPRNAIIAVAASATWDQLVAAFAEHGHSRMLVTGENLDDIRGMILIKDVFPFLTGKASPPKNWASLIRQPLFVPQARRALDVLADMRSKQVHLAVVVDEYSGTDGIVTIEDLVEEIVGEIEDEHDDAPVPLMRALADGVWDVDARIELDELGRAIDKRFDQGYDEVDTLAGLAMMLAGQVPGKGARLDHPSGWQLEVTAANDRQVTRLRLHPPTGQES